MTCVWWLSFELKMRNREWGLLSPIHARCHPFFVRVVVVADIKTIIFRVLIWRVVRAVGCESLGKLTGVWRGTFFRINVFFVWVVVGEPVFCCSAKLGMEVG